MTTQELYDSVTDHIVSTLERGDLPPWRKPWAGGDAFLPLRHNGVSYRGINLLLLWIQSGSRGYSSPYYLTFKQALEYGGCVRKGEKSAPILWCEPRSKTETAEDGSEMESRFWTSKIYRVFNAEQCDGLPERYTTKPVHGLDPLQRIENAETFVRNTGADVRHGAGGAYYRPSEDDINLPAFERFESPATFYGTALHELAHWTGHVSRLNRDLKGLSHRRDYAGEEIVAELGASFLAAQLGVEPTVGEDHAAYLAFCIAAMK